MKVIVHAPDRVCTVTRENLRTLCRQGREYRTEKLPSEDGSGGDGI